MKKSNELKSLVIKHFNLKSNETTIKESIAREYLALGIERGIDTIDDVNSCIESLYKDALLTQPKGKETYSQTMLDFEKEVKNIALEYTKRHPELCFINSKGSIRFFDKNQNERSYSSNFANESMRKANRKASENKSKLEGLEKGSK